MATILLIDDDVEVLKINKKYLTAEGFTVYTTANPKEGVLYARKLKFECIILDVMMPGADGFQVCRKIREFSSCPIIFLTGKDSEDDKIKGLLTGADDYVVKPYSLRELKARIDVLIRRLSSFTPAANQNLISIRNLSIDKVAHTASYKGTDLCLANREYEVLLYFVTHPNQDITFQSLGTALFGTYQEIDRRSVMVNVSRLRKKLSLDFELENMITTVWSKGYRFVVKER